MKLRFRFKHWVCTKLPLFGYPRGIVLYPYVLFKYEPNAVVTTFKHEMMHVYQIQRDGLVKFYIKYLYYQIKFGYKNNLYEIECRQYALNQLTTEEQLLFNKVSAEYYKEN
jgi:hypothetical protein